MWRIKRAAEAAIVEHDDVDFDDDPGPDNNHVPFNPAPCNPAPRKSVTARATSIRKPPPLLAQQKAAHAAESSDDDCVEHDDDGGDLDGEYVDRTQSLIDEARARLPPPSEEQQRIVDAISRAHVAVDAVAGSGKTTTIQYIAMQYSTSANTTFGRNILLLTYNAKLKFETRSRADALGIRNLEVHTYHAFCVRYIHHMCHKDSAIEQEIYDTDGSLKIGEFDTPEYSMVIIDEAQDMTPLYYDVARLAIANSNNPRIVVLGDRNQSIYGFKGADTRYITMAERIYGGKWERHSLLTSYRVTRQIASFVNLLTSYGNTDAPIMRAVKDGPLPKYMWCSKARIAQEIGDCAAKDPGSVFVLAASVKQRQNHPYAPIVNALVERKILVHVPTSDDVPTDPKVTQNKVVFSTFHQAKGLERKHVFVLNFDATQIRSAESFEKCSNELYVACTRSLETLTVWHDNFGWPNNPRYGTLPYLPETVLEDKCEYHPVRPTLKTTAINDIQTHEYYESVTELLRHMPDTYLIEAMSNVNVVVINEPSTVIEIPCVAKQTIERKPSPSAKQPASSERGSRGSRGTRGARASSANRAVATPSTTVIYEEVSGLTGTAVAAAHEIAKQGKCSIQHAMKRSQLRLHVNIPEINKVLDPHDPPPLLRLTTYYDAHITNLQNTTSQIVEFNWVTPEQMSLCVRRLCNLIPETDAKYEESIVMPEFDPRVVKSVRKIDTGNNRPLCVHGRSDIVVGNRLYEIKAVHMLSDSHIAQLLMYYYGYMCIGQRKAMYLYNVLTDELCKVEVSDANLLYAMKVLNHAKNHVGDAIDDAAFLAKCNDDTKYTGVRQIIEQCEKCKGKFLRI